jgi:molybdate transport system permease protein
VRVFFTVTLPLILPGILSGAVLSFARSLGEFGATITFVSNIPGQTRTLPLALYTLTQTPGGDAGALRLCAMAVIISLLALVVSEALSRRLRAATGR